MGLSQELSIDIDEDKKPDISVKTLAVDHNDKSMSCVSNRQDHTAFAAMELYLDSHTSIPVAATESPEVDIVQCTDTANSRLADADDDPNATELSSSFSGTVSGPIKDGSRFSDAEVESRLSDDNGINSSLFDGFDSLFRMKKKKLTAHWRSFIHPLMWRCKWVELRVKEFQSQALKYDRELATYDQKKRFQLRKCTSEGCARSLPYCEHNYRKKFMMRRKRKRIEDKVDIPSYMSHHNLFSYYENKRSDVDGGSVDDDSGLRVFPADVNSNDDLDINYPWPLCESRDDQHVLEKVLLDIETAQSQVKKLKVQLNELFTVHAAKFSSMENLSLLVQSDPPTNTARSPTSSPPDGDKMLIGPLHTPPHHISDCDITDLIMPESAVSSDGEVTPLPDVIDGTLALLTAVSGRLDQPQIGDSCTNVVDKVVIPNQTAEDALNGKEKVGDLLMEKAQEAVREEDKISVPASIPEITVPPCVAASSIPEISVPPCVPASSIAGEPNQEGDVAQDQSVLKSCLGSDFLVPKNKRRRVQRKARLGAWKAGKISRERSESEPSSS